MKTLLLVTTIFASISVFSQSSSMFVDSLTISPVSPNTTDSVTIIAYIRHATAGSGWYDTKIFMSDTVINVYSCWTQGPLQETEYVNDTFTLAPLDADNYTIRFIYKSLRPWEWDSVEPCLTNRYYDSTFLSFTVFAPNTIHTLEDRNIITVYPNPTEHLLNVELAEIHHNGFYQIISANGQMFKQKSVSRNTFSIDVNTMPTGLYLLRINDGKQWVVKKFIKE